MSFDIDLQTPEGDTIALNHGRAALLDGHLSPAPRRGRSSTLVDRGCGYEPEVMRR